MSETLSVETRERRWGWIALVVVVAIIGLLRARLFDVPLERDEGEYAYAGQLLLKGIAPYQLAYNMKLPGTYVAYAAVMGLFGQTPAGVHVGLLVVNAAAIVLVYLLGKRLVDEWCGVAAAAAYGVSTLGPWVLGSAAHATHFVVVPALAGVLVLLRGLQSGRASTLFWSGALFGLGFVAKQQGGAFVLFGAAFLAWSAYRRQEPANPPKALTAFGLGAAAPFALTCAWLAASGVFPTFWFWTFSYATEYGTSVSIGDGLGSLSRTLPDVAGPTWPVWALATIGLAFLFVQPRVRSAAPLLIGLLAGGAIATAAGLHFRRHYFVLLFPALALLAGVGVSGVRHALASKGQALSAAAGAILILLTGALPVQAESRMLLQLGPNEFSRTLYGANPFPESEVIAKWVAANSAEGEAICVFGSEPQIYFYADRPSATGYIYTYGLMEEQRYAARMQDEMIAEIERAEPRLMISVNVDTSWLVQPDSDTRVFRWQRQYRADNYELVGIIEILPGRTEVLWGAEARAYVPAGGPSIVVHRRTGTVGE